MPMKAGVRRHQPFNPATKNMKVPLWTPEVDGEEFDGVIRVPVRLCNTVEHTNARHEFNQLITANLQRWVEWRKLRGWYITNTPQVSGPFDPPENEAKKFTDHAVKKIGEGREAEAVTQQDYGEEIKWYIAKARFKREEPLYIGLDDHLYLRHLALMYDIDPDRDKPTVNTLPEPKDDIWMPEGVDAMVEAEASRQARGLRRKDYLMGRVQDPL